MSALLRDDARYSTRSNDSDTQRLQPQGMKAAASASHEHPQTPLTEQDARSRPMLEREQVLATPHAESAVPMAGWGRLREHMAAFGDHSVEQEALAARLDAASDKLPTAWEESFVPMLDGAQNQWREHSADALRSLHVHLLRLRELLLYAPDAHKRLRAQLQQATSCSERAFQVLRQSAEAEEKQGRARAAKIQIEKQGRAAAERTAVAEATRLRAALLEEQRRGETARSSWAAREAAFQAELKRLCGSARAVAEECGEKERELSSHREIVAEFEAQSALRNARVRAEQQAIADARAAQEADAHAQQAQALRLVAAASSQAASQQAAEKVALAARCEVAETQLAQVFAPLCPGPLHPLHPLHLRTSAPPHTSPPHLAPLTSHLSPRTSHLSHLTSVLRSSSLRRPKSSAQWRP